MEPTFSADQLVSTTSLQRNTASILRKIEKEPVVIIKNNKPVAVMLSFDNFYELVNKK